MIHHVFATKSNIGDWLSARGIQSLLAPFKITEHLCDEPFVDETLMRLSAATPNDLIIIGGGGLFMDYFAPFWESFREIVDRVPFCIWGVGCCDLKRTTSRLPEKLLYEIVTKSRICIVRDELTRSYLGRYALPPPVPCPAMMMVEPPQQKGYGLLYADHYDVVGPDGYKIISAIAKEFAAHTGRNYCETNNDIAYGSEQALIATLDRYAAADLVVSSRLHGCIIALAMGRKVIAISGDRKVESFMHCAGLSDWVCDINDIDSLRDRLLDLPGQHTPWEFINWVRQENRFIAKRVRALVKDSNR